ncbi:MAG: serine hydrolase domain-containing protein [Pseudomonadota bacterium]
MNIKSAGIGLGAFAVALGLGWWAIGPDWRALLSDPPRSNDVFELTTEQRTVAIRMADRVPFIVKKRQVPAGNNVRELPIGDDLKIDLDVEAILKVQHTTGLVILHKGKIRKEFYDMGFGPRERTLSFSVGKSFMSTLLGAAIQDGYISSVDQPVTDFIPELKGSAYDNVTVEHLLTMTSGVQWSEDYDDPESDFRRWQLQLLDKDKKRNKTPIVVSFMKQLPRRYPPGQEFYYNSAETALIGILVDRAIDQPMATYLSEKIWKPFGMEDDANWLLGEDGAEIASGAIMVTTRDYARFGLFITEQLKGIGETIVPQNFLKDGTSYLVKTPGNAGYGYQWWIPEPTDFPDPVFHAEGVFGQTIFIDPKRDLVIALNSSWPKPNGDRDIHVARKHFWQAVQKAIDVESGRMH